MTQYVPTVLQRDIVVDSVVTVHYLEHTKNYVFDGEKHDFWELVYVDKGRIQETAGSVVHELAQGQYIFHRPNEYHNLCANGTVAPNIVIVSFVSHSPAMAEFVGRKGYATQYQRDTLSRLIHEARQAFSCPLGDPAVLQMTCEDEAPFGSQQMVTLLLESLLIDMMREPIPATERPRVSSSVKRRADCELTERVIRFMEEHLCDRLSFADVCLISAQSTTNLKTIFKSVTGMGVMEYYRMLKIEHAKTMLREGHGNITQIADTLGYNSVHYFSRHFKQATGMTPREYTQSVQAN